MSLILKYCPICNKSSDRIRFVGEFCESCAIDKMRRDVPTQAVVSQCRGCLRIRTKLGHKKLDKESLALAIAASVKSKANIEVLGFDETHADVRFTYETYDGNVALDARLRIKKTHEMCTDCFRRRSGYFEATVQLRGNPVRIESMLKKLTRYLERRNAFVSKAEDVVNGIDVYTSDKLVTNEFFKEYELKPGRSYTLYGLKHGNKLYRNTYILRL